MTWVMIVQTLVLAITGLLIWRYTIETTALREEMVRQNNLSLRPVVLPEFRRGEHEMVQYWVRNVGNACAVNVAISPRRITEKGGVPFELRFKGCAYLPPGKDSLMEGSPWLGESPHHPPHSGDYYPAIPVSSLAKSEESEIRFSDVEGQRYGILITIHPGQVLPSSVDIGPIQRLWTSHVFHRYSF